MAARDFLYILLVFAYLLLSGVYKVGNLLLIGFASADFFKSAPYIHIFTPSANCIKIIHL